MATNKIEVLQSNGRFSIYLNDHRIVGMKPLPNAKVVLVSEISADKVRKLLEG